MSYFGTIYADTELPSRARAVYMYLRALTDLEQHGYLQKIPRYRDNGSSTSNLYSVQ